MYFVLLLFFCLGGFFFIKGYYDFSRNNVNIRIRTEALQWEPYYFIDAQGLWGIAAESLDKRFELREGVPLPMYNGIGQRFNPAYIAWYGLMNLNRYLDTQQKEYLDRFTVQVQWAVQNARTDNNGLMKWDYDFDWPNGDNVLRAPWMCGLAQGLMCSLFIRAYRITGNKEYLDFLNRIAKTLTLSFEHGGIVAGTGQGIFLEEYPVYPLTLVLDGSIIAALAVYDLYMLTGKPEYHELFSRLHISFLENIRIWNFRNRWTWYGTFSFLSNVQYHMLNTVLMKVLMLISDKKEMLPILQGWENSLNRNVASYFMRLALYATSMTMHVFYMAKSVFSGSVLRARFIKETP